MQFVWTVKMIWPRIVVGQNNTPKVTVVFEEKNDRDFKDSLAIDFLWEKADLIDQVAEWEEVTVFFNFRATEYNGKYYNNLNGWKLEKSNGTVLKVDKQAPAQSDDMPF